MYDWHSSESCHEIAPYPRFNKKKLNIALAPYLVTSPMVSLCTLQPKTSTWSLLTLSHKLKSFLKDGKVYDFSLVKVIPMENDAHIWRLAVKSFFFCHLGASILSSRYLNLLIAAFGHLFAFIPVKVVDRNGGATSFEHYKVWTWAWAFVCKRKENIFTVKLVNHQDRWLSKLENLILLSVSGNSASLLWEPHCEFKFYLVQLLCSL